MASGKPVAFPQKKSAKPSLEERMAKFRRERDTVGVSWHQVSALSLRCALHAVLHSDAAIMFSPASGGLGVCMTVFQDSDKQKIYESTAEDLNIALDMLVDLFQGSAEDLRQALANGAD